MTRKVKESGRGKHLGMLIVEEDAYCGMAIVGEDRRNNSLCVGMSVDHFVRINFKPA